ncbi:Na+/H+ antiporter NhaC family protein [Fulvitalea axinellae]
MTSNSAKHKGNPVALLPLVIFLVTYLGVSLISGDFYKMPAVISFLIAAISAFFIKAKEPFGPKAEIFSKGAGNSDIVMMCVIFVLAGAFAQTARAMGAVDATVNLGLSLLPSNVLLAGVFIIACFISLSVGTSVGTIAALAPMAVGLAEQTGGPTSLALSAVVGGAMFGDNLSMISDTTIAATRTQGCSMKDKFRANLPIVFPAAICTALIYAIIGLGGHYQAPAIAQTEILKILPYVAVLIAALFGMNVFAVLIMGTLLCGCIGMATGSFDFWGFVAAANKGIHGMADLIILSLLIGGTVALIGHYGGIQFLLKKVLGKIRGRKSAEAGIVALTGIVNLCTANNTVAIITAGPIVKKIADEYGVSPKRSASLMDTSSCFFQGTIPYGAQLLTAVSVAGFAVTPLEVMQYLFYPYLMGVSVLLGVLPVWKSFRKLKATS